MDTRGWLRCGRSRGGAAAEEVGGGRTKRKEKKHITADRTKRLEAEQLALEAEWTKYVPSVGGRKGRRRIRDGEGGRARKGDSVD